MSLSDDAADAAARASASDVEQQHSTPTAPVKPVAPSRAKLDPSDRLTPRQIFYIFGMHGVGALLISGGINFAIGYGMYANEDPITRPIRLWQFPNTLAGDTAVTIIVQCLVTWFIESAILHNDLRTGGVQPLRLSPRPSSAPLLRRILLVDERGPGKWNLGNFIIAQIIRALAVALAGFFLLWPPSVGALRALGRYTGEGGVDDWAFDPKWTPEIFKGVLGGVLGLLATPVFAAFWIVRAGWRDEVADDR